MLEQKKSFLGGIIMDAFTNEAGDVISQYPKTVGITQRDKILEDSGKSYDFSADQKNVIYRFADTVEDSDMSFTQDVAVTNNGGSAGNFNYSLSLQEKINDQYYVEELSFPVPVSIDSSKSNFMESFGFQYTTNDSEDIRKSFFNTFCNYMIPIQKDYSSVFESSFESLNKEIVKLALTDKESDEIPVGYKFGYVTESLSTNSFTYYNPDGITPYNIDESEKVLGKFGSKRIVPLDPSKYGGRYSSPPFFVEPRQFKGWLELSTKAFDSPSGCDPKQPPLLTFGDIKQRTKDLGNQLREDPRLGRSLECVAEKPFHHLLDTKTKSKLDGTVRTTIRTYVAEYFFKGYGLFSNLELVSDNFDQAIFLYITRKMKSEMYDLGTSFSNNRITIVREKYWFTFLEQCVEAYQRMIDVDGITPPENVYSALNEIQRGIDKYVAIDSSIKEKDENSSWECE